MNRYLLNPAFPKFVCVSGWGASFSREMIVFEQPIMKYEIMKYEIQVVQPTDVYVVKYQVRKMAKSLFVIFQCY